MNAYDADPYAVSPAPMWCASLDDALAWAWSWNWPVVAFFVAQWCEWSARLFAETLADGGVRGVLQHVLCTRIEGDADLPLVERWNIDLYPTAIVLAPNGAELGRIRGFEDAATWATRLHEILMRGAMPRQAG